MALDRAWVVKRKFTQCVVQRRLQILVYCFTKYATPFSFDIDDLIFFITDRNRRQVQAGAGHRQRCGK